jgi:hypothetical protein
MRSKKGIFFTFIAIFIVILIIAVVSTRETYRYREKSNAISSRVNTMNDFVDDFEKDLERELFIGGYRALISLNAYTRMTQNYIPDIDSTFAEIFINGTANGTAMDLMQQESQGAYFNSWLQRINEESDRLNIDAFVFVNKVELVQNSPWTVSLLLNATVSINDSKGIASWNFNKIYSKEFTILGFEDPIYTIGTEDKVTNLINTTPNSDFVNDGTKDASVLSNHLTNSYYFASNKSPSFLMRFSGNFSGSQNGIESMINLEKLAAQGIGYKPKPIIDYIYFGNITTAFDLCNVSSMPSWFRIDTDHEEDYEIDLLNSTTCP